MSKTRFLQSLISVDSTKIAIFNGLRTAIAVGVPLIIGVLTGHTLTGMTIAVGALLVSLTDVGSPYQTKAVAMITATIGVAISAFIGTLVGGYTWLAVPLMFLWGVGAGFAGVYGITGSAIGLVISIAFLSAIYLPNNLGVAFEVFIQNIAGGAWATVLSLFLWFFKPYQPIQNVISNCYSSLTGLITAFDEIIQQGSISNEQSEHIIELEQKARDALEVARSQLIAVRLTQHGANVAGEHLLVLFEIANQMLDTTIVLTQLLESANQSQIASVRMLIKDAFNQMALTCGALVLAVKNGNAAAVETESMNNIIATLEQQRDKLRIMLAEAHTSNIAQMAQKLIEYILIAVDTVKCLCVGYWKIDDSKIPPLSRDRINSVSTNRVSTLLTPLRANFTFESVILRHALRVGITTAFSIIVYNLFHLPHGFWITLTVIVILKPDFGSTLQRAFHRMGGTIIGAALATVLAITIHSKFVLLIFIILMTFAAISLISVNYGFATFFITPLVVLLLNLVNPNVEDWQLAGIRIFSTIIGAGLALVGGYLLFPSWERLRFPRQLARALTANQVYNQRVLSGYI
jgi:uncharacterized membrane protein YccC